MIYRFCFKAFFPGDVGKTITQIVNNIKDYTDFLTASKAPIEIIKRIPIEGTAVTNNERFRYNLNSLKNVNISSVAGVATYDSSTNFSAGGVACDMEIYIYFVIPLAGGNKCKVISREDYNKRRAIYRIQNNDNACTIYAIAAGYYNLQNIMFYNKRISHKQMPRLDNIIPKQDHPDPYAFHELLGLAKLFEDEFNEEIKKRSINHEYKLNVIVIKAFDNFDKALYNTGGNDGVHVAGDSSTRRIYILYDEITQHYDSILNIQ